MTRSEHSDGGVLPTPKPDRPNDRLAPLTGLPPLDSTLIMADCVKAHRALAELNRYVDARHESRCLWQGLSAREVQAGSAIEGIYTHTDSLLEVGAVGAERADAATQEALRCGTAFEIGSKMWEAQRGFSTGLFVEICHQVKPEVAGIRMQEVFIGNPYRRTRSYTPPSNPVIIRSLLDDLAAFMNNDSSQIDPLIRMAIAHYQFEAIHPFIDGNGRTGRVLNMLYLLHRGLLDAPILYLSEYILKYRGDYYTGLRNVTFNHDWESWVCYMLRGVTMAATDSLSRCERINNVRELVQERAEREFKRQPSAALLDHFFAMPYSTVADVQQVDGVSRPTAARRLRDLESAGIIKKDRVGRHHIYYVAPLIRILTEKMPGDDLVTMSEDTLDYW